MTSRNSLQWRLQKGGLQLDTEVISRKNYFLRDGKSIAGQIDRRQADTVYYVDGDDKLQENSLVYEQDSCGNFRGDINVRNSEISRHPYIDGLLANIHIPLGGLLGGIGAGVVAEMYPNPSAAASISDPFNATALGIGTVAIIFVSYLVARFAAYNCGSLEAWKTYKKHRQSNV